MIPRLTPLICAFILPFYLAAQDTDEFPTPSQEEILQAIEDLSSSEFLKREAAAKLLWEAGKAAQGPLEKAVAKEENLEAKLRAEQILKKFRMGIYPDTPPEVIETLRRFQGANVAQRRMIFSTLMQQQDYELVANLLYTLEDEERDVFVRTLFQASERNNLVAPFLLKGDLPKAEALLKIMSTRSGGGQILAAYHRFSGSLDEAIEAAESSDDDDRFDRLAWFYRAKGDLPAAMKAAEKIPDLSDREQAITSIKVAGGDVREYLKSLPVDSPEEQAAIDLTEARLDGDAVKLEAKTQELLDLAEREERMIGFATKALIINDLPQEILEFVETRSADRTAELLVAQRRPADLLRALGIDKKEDLQNHFDELTEKLANEKVIPADPAEQQAVLNQRLQSVAILIHLSRLHLRAGYLEKADSMFAQIGEAIIKAKAAPQELAFLITRAADAYRVEVCVELVRVALKEWPEIGAQLVPRIPLDDAGNWWGTARNMGRFEPDLISSFDRFLEFYPGELKNPENESGEPTEAQLERAKDLITASIKNAEVDGNPFFSGMGERAEALGFLELAEDAFTRHVNLKLDRDDDGLNPEKFAPLRALGDFYARHDRWEEAIEAYKKASEIKLSRDPVSVYTLSWAYKNAGEDEQSEKALKLARLLPLGDMDARSRLAEEMIAREEVDHAMAEWTYIYQNSDPDSWEQGRAAQILARKMASEEKWELAANYYDRLLYSTLPNGPSFTNVSSYLQVRAGSQLYRAMAEVSQGDGEAAAKAAMASSLQQPADPTISEELFPKLDALGQKDTVDKIFERAFEISLETCELFPNDGQAHNSLAWLAARSNRRLDEALKHAETAVSLEPDSAAFIDTLAEVYFAKGNREKAIELSNKAVELSPDDEEIKKQNARFKGEDS